MLQKNYYMQKKRLLETIPKHPPLLSVAQNLGVLRPLQTKVNFFWDTLYIYKQEHYFALFNEMSIAVDARVA